MECRCGSEIPNRLPLPAWRARICARGDLRAPLAGEGYVGWLWYWVTQTSRDNRPARPGSGRRRNSHPSCADRESPRLAYPSVCLRAPWCEPALSAAPTGTESGLAGGCAFRGPASSPEVTLHSQGCPRSSSSTSSPSRRVSTPDCGSDRQFPIPNRSPSSATQTVADRRFQCRKGGISQRQVRGDCPGFGGSVSGWNVLVWERKVARSTAPRNLETSWWIAAPNVPDSRAEAGPRLTSLLPAGSIRKLDRA